ncbi:MAG: TM2 domain-containing protein [Gemmatimonadaceae bacterium]
MADIGPLELALLTKDLPDSTKLIFQSQYSSAKKDRGTAVILALFMYDRIWLGDITVGIIKILTCGGCGIWTIADLFTAGSRADTYNREKAREIAASLRVDTQEADPIEKSLAETDSPSLIEPDGSFNYAPPLIVAQSLDSSPIEAVKANESRIPNSISQSKKSTRITVIAVLGIILVCFTIIALTIYFRGKRAESASEEPVQSTSAAEQESKRISQTLQVQQIEKNAPVEVLTPPPGSKLRADIMDAMRPRVEEILRADVKFVVSELRVGQNFAYFVGHPIHKTGREFTEEENRTAFDGKVYDGTSSMMAWLVKQDGTWVVKELLINQSDVGYMGWCAEPEMRQLMGGQCG